MKEINVYMNPGGVEFSTNVESLSDQQLMLEKALEMVAQAQLKGVEKVETILDASIRKHQMEGRDDLVKDLEAKKLEVAADKEGKAQAVDALKAKVKAKGKLASSAPSIEEDVPEAAVEKKKKSGK